MSSMTEFYELPMLLIPVKLLDSKKSIGKFTRISLKTL